MLRALDACRVSIGDVAPVVAATPL